MMRPFVGLAVLCFLVGCGTSTPEATTASKAPDVAAAATEVKTSPEVDASTRTVAYRVPGMT